MGYDLHITRADSWLDSAEAPIPVAEWVEAARRVPELNEADPEQLNDNSGNPAFLLGDDHVNAPALYWDSVGKIVVRGADQQHVPALLAVSRALEANLIGDDDEVYGP